MATCSCMALLRLARVSRPFETDQADTVAADLRRTVTSSVPEGRDEPVVQAPVLRCASARRAAVDPPLGAPGDRPVQGQQQSIFPLGHILAKWRTASARRSDESWKSVAVRARLASATRIAAPRTRNHQPFLLEPGQRLPHRPEHDAGELDQLACDELGRAARGGRTAPAEAAIGNSHWLHEVSDGRAARPGAAASARSRPSGAAGLRSSPYRAPTGSSAAITGSAGGSSVSGGVTASHPPVGVAGAPGGRAPDRHKERPALGPGGEVLDVGAGRGITAASRRRSAR